MIKDDQILELMKVSLDGSIMYLCLYGYRQVPYNSSYPRAGSSCTSIAEKNRPRPMVMRIIVTEIMQFDFIRIQQES
jgi:hypothetical protein